MRGDWDIIQGENPEALAALADGSIDAVVTDPPYELAFMGKRWDASGIAYNVDLWREVWRVLKPGGHVLAFGGTRTYHRMACAIEDAGFEIRDSLHWLYGSGFPKSHDISKAIDKMAGAEREVIGTWKPTGTARIKGDIGAKPSAAANGYAMSELRTELPITAPATDEARQWNGWGTALKPAHEPIVLARKPLSASTIAANVLAYGTGAINVDGCRVGSEARPVMVRTSTVVAANAMAGESTGATSSGEFTTEGRWPANLLLSHLPSCNGSCAPGCPVAELDSQSGIREAGARPAIRNVSHFGNGRGTEDGERLTYDTGGASRFFPTFRYNAKASRAERNAGLEGMPLPEKVPDYKGKMAEWQKERGRNPDAYQPQQNHHPTVKPIELMRWLCRLITPPGGLILDPFTGSGSTGCAAVLEGFRFLGIERETDYIAIARRRIDHWAQQRSPQLGLFDAV